MIIDFSVENFFSIKEKQTLSFLAEDNIRHLDDYYVTEIAGMRILKAGLIFGANASGKSTLVEGIEMMKRITLGPLAYGSEPLYNWDSKNPYTEFSIVFTVGQFQYHYTI